MIYLIDDKKIRQERDYGWATERLNEYNEFIRPIYTLSQLTESRKSVFQEDSIILFHESFLDKTRLGGKADVKRSELEEYARENNNLLVIFSGSKSSRIKEGNIVHMPVSVLYQNLEIFIKKIISCDLNPDYLLFGENHEIEKELASKLEEAVLNIDIQPAIITNGNSLFIRTREKYIQNPIEGATIKQIVKSSDDESLSDFINEFLSDEVYENIFIPLCFGNTLSDYNGLRLASHIRCTRTPNNLSNIFIYSFIGLDFLLTDKYFNILKSKNVELVDFKKSAFMKAVDKVNHRLTIDHLPKEVAKLKLDPPKNYEDDHSIANEWAIYRWAYAINVDDKDIKKIISKIDNQIYFKYLRTIYPVSEISKINTESLKINNLINAKILYVDDEVDKGWNGIIWSILDKSGVGDFDCLGDELRDKSKKEIIDLTIKQVNEQDSDIVILDFRLNESDFIEDVQEITGLKILKEIKKINPGIQVVIFSATNKIWNLQALEDAGVDGFILKEAPDNSKDSDFTSKSVIALKNAIDKANKRIFLKDIFRLLDKTKGNILNCDYEDDTNFHDFLKLLGKQVDIIYTSCKKIDLKDKSTLDIVFLNCFNFLENFKNEYYLNFVDNRYVLGIEESEMNRYTPKYNRKGSFIENKGIFIPNNEYDSPSFFNVIAGLVIDYFGICNYRDFFIKELNRIKDTRNDFIHGTKQHFNQNDIKMIVDFMVKLTKDMKE